jgi:hypothetical protein
MLFFRALELAVIHEPVRCEELIVERRPLDKPPRPRRPVIRRRAGNGSDG